MQVEIIYATRGVVLDVDNTPKRILDALKGIVYVNDAPRRAVKSVGLRLDQGFRARGSPEVYKRLLSGKEFLVNVADANTPATEKPSLVTLVIGQPAAASPAT